MTRDSSFTAARVAVLGMAALLGVVIAFVPWQVSVTLMIAALAVLGLAAVRVSLRIDDTPTGSEVGPEPRSDPRLRLVRIVYYLGAASIGFLTVRPALGFTASDWVFLLSLLLLVLAMTVHDAPRDYLVPSMITLGVVLFAAGGLVSTTNAVDAEASLLVVIRMLYLTLVWFWLGTVVLQTRAHVRNALVAWVCSAALSSGGAVAQFFYGDVIPGGSLAWGRMTGFTPTFNHLGGLAATAFVPALMLAVDSRRSSLRLVGAAATALIGAGLLLSGSVGGLLAASAATVFWLAVRGLSLQVVVGLGAVVGSAFVLMSATGVTNAPSPVERISRVTSAEEAAAGTGGTFYTRLDGYGKAWSRIHEQPFVGVGLDDASSAKELGDPDVAHNIHSILINPWFSAGVFGLVGMLLLLYGAFACGLTTLRLTSAQDRSLVAALLAGLLAFAIFAMGEPILFVRYGWFPTALLIAVRAQYIRAGLLERRRAPSRSSTIAYGSTGTS